MRVLSVDLGTSNTVAVLSAHGRPPRVVEVDGSATMPSAVFAAEDGALLVGCDAERHARLDPARYEPNPKRRVDDSTLLLGDRIVPVTDTLAAVLGRVADETARQLGGTPPDEVRLTHPAQWGPVRRNVLLAAARLAGLGPDLVLVPEPVAAAAHYASFPDSSLAPGQALAVYDLGAGTFDCAVVGATRDGYVVLAEDGLPDLGGLDVDQALLEHVGRQVSRRDPTGWQRLLRPESTADRRAQRALREDVRAGKEALSRHPQTEIPLPEPFDDVLVTRAELEGLVRPNLLRSVELLAATIHAAGLQPHALAGIYLVGGSSRIPLIATLIADQLRIVPTSLDQPETAVAFGAHHVPGDGGSMRTQDMGPRLPAPSGTRPVAGVPTGPQPAVTHSAPACPQPPTATQPPATPPAGQPYQPTYPVPPAPPVPTGSRRKPVLIGLAVLLLVVLGVTGGVFLATRGSSVPTAEDCQDAKDKDEQGFTPCLRHLAGAVPDKANCGGGFGGLDVDLRAVGGTTMVSCRVSGEQGGYSITYAHLPSPEAAEQNAETVMSLLGKGDRVEADWAGNGFRGRYQAAASNTLGMVAFTVQDRPVMGYVVAAKLGGSELTPDALADYFEKNIQPGT
ncbi:molecular chaperone Hsp70 [Longimycelium tulufanense]|uniref:Molecular chaperone Hsp70 n=1 Tax=Longimycelium tulufanense TaxID=907463 RepID=A0A8J3CGD6_9PSEU|nr:Hsp70 family protein [Longimycelium tulufanense]GGM61778.1 molecular chaperone Hsp70 [Longimycelium tulufanense]